MKSSTYRSYYFFSVLQTIETSFGFMTHLKECMQRQLFKSPKLSFGLAKFQLPLSVLLKRVSLSNKDRCGEQRACIRCKYLPSSDDFLSIPKNISISISNLISCLHFIDKLGFIWQRLEMYPPMVKLQSYKQVLNTFYTGKQLSVA